MGTERKPPQSAQELLERYARGERIFIGAKLREAKLQHAHLNRAEFYECDLSGADLRGADLSTTSWGETDIMSADLRGASLVAASGYDASFARANLADADLSHSDWLHSSFYVFRLDRAKFESAFMKSCTLQQCSGDGMWLSDTSFVDSEIADLCQFARTMTFHDRSHVDVATVISAISAPALEEFLQRTGMPALAVLALTRAARQLERETPGLLQSTFISYGGPDEPFARKLYEALHKNGATTFFFPEHAVPGKKIGRTMRQGVNDFDRILLICSKNSLVRKGVLAEIEHSLSREDREGGAELVIPVVLDDYLFFGWNPANRDVLVTLKERVAADFRGWNTDSAKFDAGLRKLIAVLKK